MTIQGGLLVTDTIK